VSAVLAPRSELLAIGLSDIDEVLSIERDLYAFPWTRGNFVDSISSGYSVWGYRVGGELIGYFVLMLAVDEAHLLNIGVVERQQGMGFGARLLSHALLVARQAGATSVLLEVRPSNAKALALYRHFGFEPIGVRQGYYPAAQGREDALILRRTLDRLSA